MAGLILTVVGLLPSGVSAQLYYGQNKVQYTAFDWQMMTTDHFNIYFYTEETEIAQIAARIAEDGYPRLAGLFNHEISKKIPLIIYSSPSYFSQTNVIPGLLPESVGGFTEFMKGRVVVPFHGSYFDFKHVIMHELVHVFTISKMEELSRRQGVIRLTGLPLWFIEGLAEYWSEDWDTEADMIVKDMVLRGDVLPITRFWQVQGTYFMYKLGQSACKFIDEVYGREKLVLIIENWIKGRSFEEILQLTLGNKIERVSDEWQYWLKKKYYPEMANLGLPRLESERLTFDGYAVKAVPIVWDDGHGVRDWIVFMAYRRGYTGIYMKPRNSDKKGLRTLVKGERSSKFESLHLLRSGIDATNSGLVAFSSKSQEQDVIYIYSLAEERIVNEFHLQGLVAARSPRFSPDGHQLVFSGIQKSGYTDLYLLDISSGNITAVTHDVYNDVDPVFSLDGRKIIFASDRCDGGDAGASNLFELDPSDPAEVRQLTWGWFNDQTPEVSSRGIFFSSNREDVYNLFLLEPSGRIIRQSTYATGAFDPRISPDGGRLVYTGYEDFQSRVYEMKLPDTAVSLANAAGLGHSFWAPRQIDSRFGKSSVKYKTDYSFDIAQSAIAYDPIYGSAGGLQASFSDILGNHAYYLLLTNTAETKDDLLQSFNFGVTYVNRTRRLNWGVGAFHLYDEYYDRKDLYYFRRQAGVLGYFSYPVSRFSRVDLTSFLRYDKKDRRYGLTDREGMLVSTFVSWVYDNSIWDISGPIEGRRYNLSAGISQSISQGRAWNRIAMADIRHYFRLGANSAFANRLFAFTSGGLEPQRIYFGGSWTFRGFDRRAFYTRKVLFASNELRFPLIDDLLIGLPFGDIGFRGIRGALFFDTGSAWDEEFDKFLGSYGFGFRVNLGYVVQFRFDFAQTTDFKTCSPGFDFDFFFGWNF
jgi:Tol biopolymer transport system component